MEEHEARNIEAPISRRAVLKYGALGAAGVGLSRAMARPGLLRQLNREEPGLRAAAKGGTLNAWTWGNASAISTGVAAVAKTSKELAGVKANVTLVPGGSDYLVAEKLSLALTAGTTLPDIVQLDYTELAEFASKPGVLMELGEVYKPVESKLYAGALHVAKYNGGYYAFARQLNGKLFFYRADLFAEAGIDPEKIETVDQYFAAGHRFTKKFPGRFIANIANQAPDYFFGMLVSAYSPVSFASPNGKYDITSNPAFSNSINFMREIHSSGIAYPTDDFDTDWPSAINKSQICAFLTATWMSGYLPEYATLSQKGKWRAIPWPKLSPLADERYGSDAGGSIYVVPKNAPNAELAVQLLRQWRLNEDGSLANFSAVGQLPLLKTAEGAVLSALKRQHKPASMSETAWGELPQNFFAGDYTAQALAAQDRVKVFGYDPSAVKEWSNYVDLYLERAVSGTISVRSALSQMQSDMESQVGNPYKA